MLSLLRVNETQNTRIGSKMASYFTIDETFPLETESGFKQIKFNAMYAN